MVIFEMMKRGMFVAPPPNAMETNEQSFSMGASLLEAFEMIKVPFGVEEDRVSKGLTIRFLVEGGEVHAIARGHLLDIGNGGLHY